MMAPSGGIETNLNAHAQLQTFPHPNTRYIKMISYSNVLIAKSLAQFLPFKSVTDKKATFSPLPAAREVRPIGTVMEEVRAILASLKRFCSSTAVTSPCQVLTCRNAISVLVCCAIVPGFELGIPTVVYYSAKKLKLRRVLPFLFGEFE